MAINSTYVIRGGAAGRERLRVLSRALAPTTLAFLDRLGIRRDARGLDVGCGGGNVTLAIAALVPDGTVVGVDLDETKLDLARAEAEVAGAVNVSYRAGDVMAEGDERYDIVYARFLLCHLPDPVTALAGLVRRLRPGGVLAVEDTDISGSLCYPPSPAFERCRDLFGAAVRCPGGDPDIGLRLPGMLLAAGLDGVGVNVVQPAGLTGDAKQIQPLTLAMSKDAIVAAGLASAEEVDDVVAALHAYADRDDTVVSTARIVQAWGRRPR